MNLINSPKILKLPRIINSKYNINNNINNFYKIPTNKYFINLLKLSKIKRENSEKKEDTKNPIENLSKLKKETANIKNEKLNKLKNDDITILNISKINKSNNSKSSSKSKKKRNRNKRKLKKKYLYSLKDFFNIENKNKLRKSLSYINSINTIEKDRKNIESNFMKLKSNANKYTANANYIKNKKMIIIDKLSYDNNIYQPDRLGLFDMSDFKRSKRVIGKGIFGHIYYNHNKYRNNNEYLNRDIFI